MHTIFNKFGRVILALITAVILTGFPLAVLADDENGNGLVDIYNRPIDRGSDAGTSENDSYLTAPEDGQPLEITPAFIPSSTFNSYIVYPMSSADAGGVGIGDFNSDGLNDVAVSDGAMGTGLWVYLQQKNGSLALSGTYPIGALPENLVAGDFNNDGRDDVITANLSNNTISVLLQTADGLLAPQVTYTTATGPDALAADDLNNDGLLDLAVSHWNAAVVGVFYQQLDGTLGTMVSYPSQRAGRDDIDTGDFNHDGLRDIVKMNGQTYSNASLIVYLQTEDGFAPPAYYSQVQTIYGTGIAAGDLTGDGLDDVAVAHGGNDGLVTIFAQNENGVLEQQDTYNAYDIPGPLEIADIDLDGRLDLLAMHGGWEALTLYYQQSNGSLSSYQRYIVPYASDYKPQGFDIGDINNDGLPDAVIADYGSGLVVLTNKITPDFKIIANPPSRVIESGTVGQVSLTLDTNLNFNGPVTYLVSSLPQGVSYAFSANPVNAPNSTTLYLYASKSATLGYDNILITGTSGSLIHSVTMNIQVVQRISGLSAANNGPTQLGSVTAFQANIIEGSDVSYIWDFGDGYIGYGKSIQHSYDAIGQYTVSVTATNSISTAQAVVTVEVVDVPVTNLQAFVIISDETNLTADFYAFVSSGTNIQYNWDFGDGATGSGPIVSHVYSNAGLYFATLTVTNGQGSQTRKILVNLTGNELVHIFLPLLITE